jgi:hypothetical protein
MRFMLLLKGDQKAESFEPPNPELITAMEAFNTALKDAGAWVDADGLQPSSAGFRLANSGGEITIDDGPFTDLAEVLYGYWLISVPDRDAAVEWARKVPFESVDSPSHTGSVEIRRIMELDDIPVSGEETGWREDEVEMRQQEVPVRDPSKQRWLMMFMADARSEAGELPEEKVFAEMGALIGGLVADGVWIGGEGLTPSRDGARVVYDNGIRSVLDGPFAETKELVAGYGIVQVGSRAEVEEIASRGARVNGEGHSEVRLMY